MPKFRVNIAVTYTVEAKDETEAEEKALDLLRKDIEDAFDGYFDLNSLFGCSAEKID